MVGLPFFVESLLQQIGVVLKAELARIRAHGAVAGDLVMLDVLRFGNKSGVEHIRLWILLNQLVALLDQSFHANAFLAARTHTEIATDLLEALCVLPRLLKMCAER